MPPTPCTAARQSGDMEAASNHISESINTLPKMDTYFESEYWHTSLTKANVLICAHAQYEYGLILKLQGDEQRAIEELLTAKDLLKKHATIVVPRVADKYQDPPEGDIILPPLTLQMVEDPRVQLTSLGAVLASIPDSSTMTTAS